MAKGFEVELTVPEERAQAQARAASDLSDAARAVGLRLTKREGGELRYRPRVQFPFLIMLWHTLNGEQMRVTFEDAPGGGTRVRLSGAVAGSNHALASDADHWAEALGVSPQG
jgi:hypothetical protein